MHREESRTPAAPQRHGQQFESLHHPAAHLPGLLGDGLARLQCALQDGAQWNGDFTRQLPHQLLFGIAAHPVAQVATATEHLECVLRCSFYDENLVGEPTEAAERDFFVRRKRAPGRDRCLPFAPKYLRIKRMTTQISNRVERSRHAACGRLMTRCVYINSALSRG